jgi:hypothetical protein
MGSGFLRVLVFAALVVSLVDGVAHELQNGHYPIGTNGVSCGALLEDSWVLETALLSWLLQFFFWGFSLLLGLFVGLFHTSFTFFVHGQSKLPTSS